MPTPTSLPHWPHSFRGFEAALHLVEEGLSNGLAPLSLLAREGLLRRFGRAVEMAWMTMGGFLEEGGSRLEVVTPKAVVRAAGQAQIISDPGVWCEMLDRRPTFSEVCDPVAVNTTALALSERYLAALRDLRQWFAARP